MAAVYVDTSALGRVLLEEPDAGEIVAELASFEQVVASRLLRVELRRVGLRHDLLPEAGELLTDVALVPVDQEVLDAAEAVVPATVGTLDAIHLATALRLADRGLLDAMMTYDTQLADAASQHGIRVIAPRR